MITFPVDIIRSISILNLTWLTIYYLVTILGFLDLHCIITPEPVFIIVVVHQCPGKPRRILNLPCTVKRKIKPYWRVLRGSLGACPDHIAILVVLDEPRLCIDTDLYHRLSNQELNSFCYLECVGSAVGAPVCHMTP